MAMEPHALVSIYVFVCQYSIQILLCMALADDTEGTGNGERCIGIFLL